MSTGWKIFIVVVIVVGIAGVLLYNKLKKSISFDFNLGGDVSGILGLLQGFRAQNKAGIYFDVPLTTIIKNNGAAKVLLQSIAGSVSYNGEPILQTKPSSTALAAVEIAKKSSQSVSDNVQLLVNDSTIKFFTELFKGNKPKVAYNFSSLVGGKFKTFSNSTTINK